MSCLISAWFQPFSRDRILADSSPVTLASWASAAITIVASRIQPAIVFRIGPFMFAPRVISNNFRYRFRPWAACASVGTDRQRSDKGPTQDQRRTDPECSVHCVAIWQRPCRQDAVLRQIALPYGCHRNSGQEDHSEGSYISNLGM